MRIRSRPARAKVSIAALESTTNGSRPYLGDIAIAPAVAKRNARRLNRSFADEMRILILHGILHLMGYDHESDEGQMDRREQRLRRELGLA
jgi:probable rRNA maturation factor